MRWLVAVALLSMVWTTDSYGEELSIAIYSDGLAAVSGVYDADPLSPVFNLRLLGQQVENFVASSGGSLLQADIVGDTAIVDTFGALAVEVDYLVHDLVSKSGRTWTFSVDASQEYSLVLPEGAIMVGIDSVPLQYQIIDERIRMLLDAETTRITYVVNTADAVEPPEEDTFEYWILAPIAAGAAAAAAVFALRYRKRGHQEAPADTEPEPDMDDIVSGMDLRPDDKEIVLFIMQNGGEVYESALRKKFLRPKTTIWRTVRRLERLGIVEVTKDQLQNKIRIRRQEEDPGE